jgi:hypothetical protein
MNELYEKCNILTVSERYKYYVLLSLYKTVKCECSILSLKELFCFQSRNGQNSLGKRLVVSACTTKIAQNSFQYQATKLWNNLPSNIRLVEEVNVTNFKKMLNAWFLKSRDEIYIFS